MDAMELTTTGQTVYALDGGRGKHTLCLFPFGRVSKKGNRGVSQMVRNDKLRKKKLGYAHG